MGVAELYRAVKQASVAEPSQDSSAPEVLQSTLGRFDRWPQPLTPRSEIKVPKEITADEAMHRVLQSKNHQHHLARRKGEERAAWIREFKERWVGDDPYDLVWVDLSVLRHKRFKMNEEKVQAIMKAPPKDDGNYPIIGRYHDEPHVILDGNHRVEALCRCNEKKMRAYVQRGMKHEVEVIPDRLPGERSNDAFHRTLKHRLGQGEYVPPLNRSYAAKLERMRQERQDPPGSPMFELLGYEKSASILDNLPDDADIERRLKSDKAEDVFQASLQFYFKYPRGTKTAAAHPERQRSVFPMAQVARYSDDVARLYLRYRGNHPQQNEEAQPQKLAGFREDHWRPDSRKTVFLGGKVSGKDGNWREEVKQDLRDAGVKPIDPKKPAEQWDPVKDIYREIKQILTADKVLFYKGGYFTQKEKELCRAVGKPYEVIRKPEEAVEKAAGALGERLDPEAARLANKIEPRWGGCCSDLVVEEAYKAAKARGEARATSKDVQEAWLRHGRRYLWGEGGIDMALPEKIALNVSDMSHSGRELITHMQHLTRHLGESAAGAINQRAATLGSQDPGHRDTDYQMAHLRQAEAEYHQKSAYDAFVPVDMVGNLTRTPSAFPEDRRGRILTTLQAARRGDLMGLSLSQYLRGGTTQGRSAYELAAMLPVLEQTLARRR